MSVPGVGQTLTHLMRAIALTKIHGAQVCQLVMMEQVVCQLLQPELYPSNHNVTSLEVNAIKQ
jgi:hypothetical protein